MVAQYDEDGCLQCGYEPIPDNLITYIPDGPERVGRGRAPMSIEILGTGIQRRMPHFADALSGTQSIYRCSQLTRYWDSNRKEMERDYKTVLAARKSAGTYAGRKQVAREYSEFLERWNLRLDRWCKLRRRWRELVAG